MKKFLTVLCLALLLTLVCASAMAATISGGKYNAADYKRNGSILKDSITATTKIQDKLVDPLCVVTIVIEPTCRTGSASIKMIDGTYETISLDPIHNLKVQAIEGSKPACESNGVGIYVCADCNAVDPYGQGQVAIAATGHLYEKIIVDEEVTCSKKGKTHKVCVYCNEPYKVGGVIEYTYVDCNDTNHKFQVGAYHIEKVQTCKEGGKRYLTCAACGEPQRVAGHEHDPAGAILYDAAYAVPADHTFGDWVVTVPASCKEGFKTRYCSVCNAKESVTIPATDAHNWKETIEVAGACAKDASGKALPAVSFSKLERTCTVCGKTEGIAAPTNYMAHHTFVYDPNGVNIPAECVGGAPGTKALICTKCQGKWQENIPAATEHKWGAWVLIVKPGEDGTENGVWERQCTNYHCLEKETYVGKTAPSGAAPVPTATSPSGTTPPSGTENYKVTSWSFTGSGVSGQVAGNVSYRTPGLSVSVIIYTPNGTFLATSAAVDEDGKFSVSAGGAVYAVSIQLKDNTRTYQTDGKYV